jgi:rhamnosyl/mannosyltransferase
MINNNFRVLQLGKFYPICGGVEKVAYDLMSGLSEQNVYCDMMCAATNGESRTISVNEHAKVICCHTLAKIAATMISPAMIFALKKVQDQYDIIHVHHPDPMACLALLLSGYKGKVVLHWHSDIQKQRILLRLYSPLQKWLIRRADKIVGTSPVYLSESPFLRKVQHKTVCLPIGVDPMCPDAAGVRKIKDRYKGKKIIFSLGRLVTYKGYEFLIAATKYLKDNYMILIGGTGALREKLQEEINSMHLRGKVKLLGHVSDEELPSYYGACDVFCLSSVQKTEAFGIVQIEAMSCGKPVVATKIPHSGVSWVNAHEESGINVVPGDAYALAKAIEAIVENGAAYDRYSEGALNRYQKLFTKEKMIAKCKELYDGLMKETKQ